MEQQTQITKEQYIIDKLSRQLAEAQVKIANLEYIALINQQTAENLQKQIEQLLNDEEKENTKYFPE